MLRRIIEKLYLKYLYKHTIKGVVKKTATIKSLIPYAMENMLVNKREVVMLGEFIFKCKEIPGYL